jgi:RNA polymerase sigma-70 factor (ECF subfamily)
MPRDASENEFLLQRALGGDCGALAELFERHRGWLEQMVRLRLDRRLQGRLDAADVLQEAYLDVARRPAVQAVTGTPSTRAPREFDRRAYSGVSGRSALRTPA